MLSVKKLFMASLLFSKIILTSNVEQPIVPTKEQAVALKQQITDLEERYKKLLNADMGKKDALKKLSVLKYEAGILLVNNSALFKKVSLFISTLIVAISPYLLMKLIDLQLNYPDNEFYFVSLCYTALASGIYTCYDIYALLNVYQQNNRLRLLIKHIEDKASEISHLNQN